MAEGIHEPDCEIAESTPETRSFGERLTMVQNDLKAPKSQYNSFGKYSYRSCEDILEAVKPLLSKYGMYLILTDEPLVVGEWHYVKATATLSDGISDTGTFVTVAAYAREEPAKKGMDAAQITGSASSYARKYALNGLFLIDDSRDADMQQPQQDKPRQQQPKPDSQRITDGVNAVVKKYGGTSDDVWMHLNHDLGINATNLTQDKAPLVIERLGKYWKGAYVTEITDGQGQ